MSRSGPNGPDGTGGGTLDPADAKAQPDETGVPAATSAAKTPVQTTRTVLLGGDDRREDPPIDLTDESEEQSAAPLIDDAGPLDPDEEEALGDLDLRATPPKPLVIAYRTPANPTLAPGRRSSEPPSNAAFRATPFSGSIIPVPPPFVPFPGVPAATQGERRATQRAAVPFLPMAASEPPPGDRAPAQRPAVSPPPPESAASAPDGPSPIPATAAAAATPQASPVPRRTTMQQTPVSSPPSAAPSGGLPKVIISEDAYRPSQRPPAPDPAVPTAAAAPVPRASPAFGTAPVPRVPADPSPAAASLPRTTPAGTRRPVEAEVQVVVVPSAAEDDAEVLDDVPEIDVDEAPEEEPSGETIAAEQTADVVAAPEGDTTADAGATTGVEAVEDAEETADTDLAADAGTTSAAEAGDVGAPAEGEAEAAQEELEAADEVAEIDAAEAAEEEEEASEETAAPVVAPPVPVRRQTSTDLAARTLEETTDPHIEPPSMDGVGVLDPMEALRAAEEAVEDVFAPPGVRRQDMASADDGDAPLRSESIDLDAVPSVISIPEDDVPRAPAASPSVLSRSAASAPGIAQADAGASEEPGSAEHAEEIVDVEVQAVEPEASGTARDRAVARQAPPRPAAAAPRPQRPRRRRRHGERRAWWEEIFDEEHIRSLPRYSAEHTRNEMDFVERALGVAKTARILDLGCGDGRQAVELAHRDYEVVGLDLSLPMLARAGEAAQAKGVKINFIQGDMRDLRFDGAFDAVYCVGSTFGYFDDDTNQAVLASVYRALKPGGRLLLGLTNRDYVTHNQPRSSWFQGDDRQYLEDTDFNFITSRLVVKRSWATSAGDQETVEYAIRLYSLHELGKILHAAGFRVIEVSGHLVTPGTFFGADSATLLLVAERP